MNSLGQHCELPVKNEAINFVTAIKRLPVIAAIIEVIESLPFSPGFFSIFRRVLVNGLPLIILISKNSGSNGQFARLKGMDAAIKQDVPVALPHDRVLIVFGGLVVVMLLSALDGTIVSTALPTIVGELGGLAHLSWVVTAYLLAQTIVTPLYGKIGDLYGRKRVLQTAIVVFLAGWCFAA